MGKVIIAKGVGRPDFLLFPVTRIQAVRSDKDVHFTRALAKGESEQENLTGLVSNKIIIQSVSISAAQPLHFRLEFYSRDSFTDSDLDVDTFIGAVELDLTKYGRLA
ncbi:unnamed protein product [marine sediment metagenome]|uniref:Uncharacterized protein n=1 Tax=marine sediment metagenome TaxID=412755 RepID=X1PXI0_9ZZZZ